jgi:CRISPR/Cas system-associated protein Cas7 (RAMP superfamily)
MCHRGLYHIKLDQYDELKGDDDFNNDVVNNENNIAKCELQSNNIVHVESMMITKHVNITRRQSRISRFTPL